MPELDSQIVQFVRIIDVFVLGPLLIWTAATQKMHPVLRATLLISGVSTIVFNAANFLEVRDKLAKLGKEGGLL